jgi:glucosamine--fructose-6-phosphate aminotransferase (isomerizing)
MIAQMIGIYLDKGFKLYDPVKYTLENKIRGTWDLCILNRDQPERLIVARKGSLIQIGLHQDAIFIASEV